MSKGAGWKRSEILWNSPDLSAKIGGTPVAKTLKWLRRSGRTAVEIAVDHVLSLQPKRWRQKEFIAKVLANSSPTLNKRFIVALSTIPDRIKGLRPTIDSLLNQTRRPDEIVLAVPKFSLRQQRPYDIPDWLHQVPDLRILRCDKDWGPATKFIAVLVLPAPVGI